MSNGLAGAIGDAYDDRGRLLLGFGPEFFGRGIGRVLAAGDRGALPALALGPFRGQGVLEVERDLCADGRIGRREVASAEISAAVLRGIAERRLDRKDVAVLRQELVGCVTKRTVVIEHINAPAEGSDNEIVHAFMDSEVANHDGGQADVELDPFLATDLRK